MTPQLVVAPSRTESLASVYPPSTRHVMGAQEVNAAETVSLIFCIPSKPALSLAWFPSSARTGRDTGPTALSALSPAQPTQVQAPATNQPSGSQAAIPGKHNQGLGKFRTISHLGPSRIPFS